MDYSEIVSEIERKYNGPWLPNEGRQGINATKTDYWTIIDGLTYYVEVMRDSNNRIKVSKID